jgi:hypothetical protein
MIAMTRLIPAGLLTLLAVAASGCMVVETVSAQAEGAFDKTLSVSGAIALDVSTGSGRITIRDGASDRVEIHGRIQAGNGLFSSRDAREVVSQLEAHPPIEQAGQTIRIGRITNPDWRRNVSISYEIVVPARADITSRSGSGSLTLRNVTGDLEASTGSGSITLAGIRGGLRARTGSGSVRVQGEQAGRWELETGSGSIDVDLPDNASFDLSAHTGSGGVEVGHPLTVQGRLDRNRHDVTGKVGSGGQLLSARTGSGHIRIQ